MFFNQTLNGRIELGSYSVGKIRFFGVALDFAIEPFFFSSSPGNLSESMIGHPPVPGYQGELMSRVIAIDLIILAITLIVKKHHYLPKYC